MTSPDSSEANLTPFRFIVRLLASTLALNLIVVLLVALTLYDSRIQHEEEAALEATNLSNLLEQNLTAAFDKIDLTLLTVVDEVGRLRSVGSLDAASLNAFIARQVARLPELSNLRVSDAQGNLLYGTAMPHTPVNIADREFFIHLRDHAEAGLYISQPIVGRTNGKWLLALNRRLNQPDGSFAGTVGAVIELDKFIGLFARLDIGRQGVITLFDDSLGFVARYPTAENYNSLIGKRNISRQFEAQLRTTPEAGVFQAISSFDSIERIFFYQKIPNYPFFLTVGMGTADFLSEWWKEVAKNIVLVAVFAFVTVGFSMSMARTWKRREADLKMVQLQEQRFRTLLEASPFPMVTADAKGLITFVNRQVVSLFGYEPHELVGQPIEMLLPERLRGGHVALRQRYAQAPQARAMGKDLLLWALAKDGREIPVNISLSPIQTDEGLMIAAGILDITERRAAEKQIEFLAYHDALTGLPNRLLLLDRLQQARASSARSGRNGALLFLDLDHFKMLNDTLGHDKGDLLLQQVARRLVASVREADTVARLGGDEFVVMLEDLSENLSTAVTQAEAVGEKILAALNHHYLLADHEYHSTPSMGITLFSGHKNSSEELLKQADLAMYQSKAAGRNMLRFFDPKMQAMVTDRAALEMDLREAVKQQQFLLYYQPQVVGAGRVTGAEALVRWKHPQRGMVSPAEFIFLAEETGLILPLGHWVLETACAQLAKWAAQASTAHLSVAVNVSANQLHQTNFVDQVLATIIKTGANPRNLKLELTESLLVSNVENTIAKMAALKAHGVGFSLDDFGTGYSSLSYLKRLPLDQLKIDQGFVRDILVDSNDVAIAKMVLALAKSLGLAVLAEGVETEAQRDFLAGLGCDAYQGYLFSRPLPLDEFDEFVKQR